MFLLTRDKFMSKMQPGFTYNTCVSFTKFKKNNAKV